MNVTRAQALRYRWRAQGLDAAEASVGLTDVAALDLGVQDGANHAGRLALVARGVAPDEAARALAGFTDELALVWSLRGAPHLYRRADLPDIQRAVSPFSEADAVKRAITAGKALPAAGVGMLDAVTAMATAAREATASGPLTKGELSAALREALPDAYSYDCRGCGVRHPYDQLFRLAPLHGGLELEPGTNPPTIRQAPGWPRRDPGPRDPGSAPARLQVVRGYLRFLGPAAPRDVAAFLETSVAEVKAHWPGDAVEASVDGRSAWILDADAAALAEASEPPVARERGVRLLSGFDLLTAAKDRELLATKARHPELWPALGRPGSVVRDGEIVGTWRPKSSGERLTITVEPWADDVPADAVGVQAELVARARGQRLAAVKGV